MVTREEVFVVTKVWATYTTRVELGLEKSLALLGLDYVDLFLVVCAFVGLFWEWWVVDVGVALAAFDEP